MELINAVLIATTLGFLIRDRRWSLGIWLAIWAVVFPIQTAVVSSAGDLDVFYWVFNAAFLALGVGMNLLGAYLRRRRDARTAAAATA